VSDLVWLDEMKYDPKTGANSIGVEFAGTAVSSGSSDKPINKLNKSSKQLTTDNVELQWSELYYRGYFELHVSKKEVTAQFFGVPTLRFRHPLEIPLGNFTVKAGDNHLQRPVGGGTVESGALQDGNVKQTNATLNTETGTWNVTAIEGMYMEYD
jgi:alkaline phosphatase D